jgi:DNA polymerase
MFVGEAPGKNEAETGKPFCGAAGKILTQLLDHIGLGRDDVYITSIVHDRPPDNRDPTPTEIDAYAPYLDKQIEVIQPRLVAPLGRYAARQILTRYGPQDAHQTAMSDLHGTVQKGVTAYNFILICPLYHPAAALYNGSMRGSLFSDMQTLQAHIT